MRLAVVGSGVAGLVSAWLLGRRHEVTLFEADERLGGHTHTHHVDYAGKTLAVDTGFIVHTPVSYPLFAKILDRLEVETQATDMSFSVTAPQVNLEYNAGSAAQLFAQPRNLMRGRFYRMLADALRFFGDARRLLKREFEEQPLGPFLRQRGYSSWFIQYHLNPMVAALWSASPDAVERFPARFLARFMRDHFMLQARGRPQWRVIKGGSQRYVKALCRSMNASIRTGVPVRSVLRDGEGVEIRTDDDQGRRFDGVVLACHSDESLKLLGDADAREKMILGAFNFQANETILHRDRRLLPQNKKAWAAWNAYVPEKPGAAVTVTYNMNILQSLKSEQPICVTLNRSQEIDPALVDARIYYQHPIFTVDASRAQTQLASINECRRTWFCGAWTGYGFHEDGVRSAVEAAAQLGVEL